MATTTQEHHIVIEARQRKDGIWLYRAVSPELDWNTAQTEWERLDDRRRTRIQGVTPSDQYFMVRNANDPTWSWLDMPRVFKARQPKSNGRDADERAARAFAKIDPQGVVRGNKGGWLYREGQREPVGQGWDSYMRQLKKYRDVIRAVPGTTPISEWNHQPMPYFAAWMILPSLAERPGA
jgi:hypothetical protein